MLAEHMRELHTNRERLRHRVSTEGPALKRNPNHLRRHTT